ncbi:MFS transporter [Brachybacterium sp. EF45031]|uniref:MFS transporter n=1 Tax=Brachybacterium sillae TaxID=2810536 RepID=UPI00217DC4C1|nr:MFS transporter [Brachybacterium sillae]MCS6712275.1 MFS transporter [Brachybacterium sillae]
MLRPLIPSIYAPTALETTGESALIPVVPVLALQLGFSVPAAAALTGIFGIASLIGPIPAGALLQRIGARRAILSTGILLALGNSLALLVVGEGLAGTPQARHRWALVALLVLIAACGQVWALGRQSHLGSALPPQFRARGMTTFGGMLRVGQVLGPLVGAAVMAWLGERAVFGVAATMSALASLMVAMFLLPQERPGRSAPPARDPRRARPAPRSAAARGLDGLVARRMLLVQVGLTPLIIARFARPVVVPLVAAAWGLDAPTIALIIGVLAVLEILLFIPAGILMDRFGRAAVAVPCTGLLGAGFALLALWSLLAPPQTSTAAVTALLVCGAILAIGNGLGSGIMMTLGLDVSPERDRTRYLTWWNTLNGVGRLLGPGLVAGITAVAPLAAASGVIGLLALGGAAWLARILPRLHLGERF